MARDNTVMLIGRITKPTVSFIEEFGTYKLVFRMTVLRSNGRMDYPRIVLYGLTESQARELWSEMKEDRYAIVRGMITTRLEAKTVICPKCGNRTEFPRLMTEVIAFAPPVVLREEYIASKFAEVSNNVTMLGTVCSQVQTKLNCTMYQLSVERSFYVQEQGSDTKSDVPWIKSFGSIGEQDALRLSPGSLVYIKGAFQTREVKYDTECSNAGCDGRIRLKETFSEIISSKVEYLHNCDFPENDNVKVEG